MNEIANMKDVTEKIKDRVKVSFFELLPDEKFAELVDVEIKAFFEATSEQFSITRVINDYSRDTYTLDTPISPFRMMVWGECKKIVEKKLEGMLTEEGLYTEIGWDRYGNEKREVSEKLEKILKKQALELASTFFTDMFAQAFSAAEYGLTEQIKNNIVSEMGRSY